MGLHASIYWADFPSKYLRTIHTIGIDKLPKHTRIKLCHTKPDSLVDPIHRTLFLKHFIALIRYLAAGHGNVGHLRLLGDKIHRTLKAIVMDDEEESEEECEEIIAPSWMVLDVGEEEKWVEKHRYDYGL